MTKTQFIFCANPEAPLEIHPIFQPEALALSQLGALIGLVPSEDATRLIWRTIIPRGKEEYPSDSRYIQGWQEYENLSKIELYYPLIADLTMPTIFVDVLSRETEGLIAELGWDRVFVKNESKSLWHVSEKASFWPDTTFYDMERMFHENFGKCEKYAIRKYVSFPHEERYWVINRKIYHRTQVIPEIVIEAEKRLRTLGSLYYTIDATPDLIIEVNPGESSDRHGVNSPGLFASWLFESFCYNG